MEQFISQEELYLFNRGRFYHSYSRFGAHEIIINGEHGVHFAVWAPNAEEVRVAGDFNQWNGCSHKMIRQGNSGVWILFVPGLTQGELYKYEIHTKDGQKRLKADPFAFWAELRPHTASIVYSLTGFAWHDQKWLQQRQAKEHRKKPVLIYEVHLGSWKRKEDNSFLSYRELAAQLIPYVKELGFTHIEVLPLMEHPYDGSWGYQVTGYYAATSRYGRPHDLMWFIDQCHQADLGVILDWVPGHFCKDEHGLSQFDGTSLFESREHGQWGTYYFDFSRTEVRSYLISNALFWLDIFHMDGLRIDGVSSMLYLDFGIEDENWERNALGGRENLEAVNFLQELNKTVFYYYPDVLMIAEESTDWPLVTWPVDLQGLGFNYKWNMGWMNDALEYAATDFSQRKCQHRHLTFSLTYAFTENFVLPLSHDEVVHGKKSLIGKMPGDYWQKFAGLRILYLYFLCHPGKKLLFMGGEFAQFIEWRHYTGLDWLLFDYETHRKHWQFVQKANSLYCTMPALWQEDCSWDGFEWIDPDNSEQSILIFIRFDTNRKTAVLLILNFSPCSYENYRLGVPDAGEYQEVFNTDSIEFGGSDMINEGLLTAQKIAWHNREYSLEIKIPPLGGVLIVPLPE